MSQGEAVSPNPPINLMSSSMATFSPTGAHAQLAHSTNTIIQGSPPDTAPLNKERKNEIPVTGTQLAIAERLARQLHEIDKQKRKEELSGKRKRDIEEVDYRVIRRKIDDQRKILEEEEKTYTQSTKELYQLFNSLQGTAKDLGLSFDYPELVVVGMQSDGKSSFIEGLLGFQFNIVETNIGTRRPLIIQMINNPTKPQPSCRFRKENPSPNEDPFEDKDTSVIDLTAEIVKRTNEVAGKGPDSVSDIPIILKVEYSHCSNLTIYDTPGFRLGGEEKLKNQIINMVTKLIRPSNRIIVCLEQSTVEWANSSSRPIVKQIDPDFSRTVLVNTKFDNRVKELRNEHSANTYLRGEDLPKNVKPFFISMPLRRNMDSSRFQDAIRECFLDDFEKLLEVNFDEETFLPQLGLIRVKNHLQKLLNDKLSQSLAPTLQTLEDICQKTSLELVQIEQQLKEHDISQLQNKASSFVRYFVNEIENLLGGSIAGNPDKNGQTLSEEKAQSGAPDWTDFGIPFNIQNAKLKVYGGAQYSRLLNEFEYVAHSREFPKTTSSEIASALGTSKSGFDLPVLETAAANLVQVKAKQVFLPLIDILLKRCSYIMKRLFKIGIDVLKFDPDQKDGIGILSIYENFTHELKNTYDGFINQIEKDCESRLKDDFVMFTKIVDWNSMCVSSEDVPDNEFLQPSIESTKKRVESLMEQRSFLWNCGERNMKMNEEGYNQVALLAAKMFAGIRYFFAKYVRNKLNAFFLDPMLQKVGSMVVNHFYRLPSKKYEDMFLGGIQELKNVQEKLTRQLAACTQQRDRFKEIYFRMQQTQFKSPSSFDLNQK